MPGFADTSAILDALKARIEALTPAGQVSEDDVYRVQLDVSREAKTGSRQILLSAQAGIRVLPSRRTCTDWETTFELLAFYTDNAVEAGQQTVLQQAITDAEQILDDLYTWSVTTDGILKFEPDPGNVADTGDGELQCSRTFRITWQRA